MNCAVVIRDPSPVLFFLSCPLTLDVDVRFSFDADMARECDHIIRIAYTINTKAVIGPIKDETKFKIFSRVCTLLFILPFLVYKIILSDHILAHLYPQTWLTANFTVVFKIVGIFV